MTKVDCRAECKSRVDESEFLSEPDLRLSILCLQDMDAEMEVDESMAKDLAAVGRSNWKRPEVPPLDPSSTICEAACSLFALLDPLRDCTKLL